MKLPILQSLLTIAFTVLLQSYASAQYTVTKIVGEVTNKTTGERLKPGSKLKDDDMLQFSSTRDMVRVVVSGKGIYIISPTPRKENQQSLIVEMLKSALKIKSKEGYLSGRSEDSYLIPEALETETAVNNLILITDQTKFLFDNKRYDVSGGNRFFLQLEKEGGKPEIHALKTNGDTLLITAADFTPSGQLSGSVKYKLGYFNKAKNSSESLAAIRPYVDTSGEMETIVTIIVEDHQETDLEKLKHVCYAEVYESLGKPSQLDFDKIFSRLTARYSNQSK